MVFLLSCISISFPPLGRYALSAHTTSGTFNCGSNNRVTNGWTIEVEQNWRRTNGATNTDEREGGRMHTFAKVVCYVSLFPLFSLASLPFPQSPRPGGSSPAASSPPPRPGSTICPGGGAARSRPATSRSSERTTYVLLMVGSNIVGVLVDHGGPDAVKCILAGLARGPSWGPTGWTGWRGGRTSGATKSEPTGEDRRYSWSEP